MAGSPLKKLMIAQIDEWGAAAGRPGIEVLLERWANGETLEKIAADLGVGRPFLSIWINNHHKELFEQYKRAKATMDVEDAVGIADASTPESFKPDKLKMEARFWRSSRYDREQFGERQQQVNIAIDMGSMFTQALEEANRLRNQPVGEIIESEVVRIEGESEETNG